jgi:hypothetical protein
LKYLFAKLISTLGATSAELLLASISAKGGIITADVVDVATPVTGSRFLEPTTLRAAVKRTNQSRKGTSKSYDDIIM